MIELKKLKNLIWKKRRILTAWTNPPNCAQTSSQAGGQDEELLAHGFNTVVNGAQSTEQVSLQRHATEKEHICCLHPALNGLMVMNN